MFVLKIAAIFCAGAYKIAQVKSPSSLKYWSKFGQAKIALKVDDENQLYDLKYIARSEGLVTYLVEDAGRTQIGE